MVELLPHGLLQQHLVLYQPPLNEVWKKDDKLQDRLKKLAVVPTATLPGDDKAQEATRGLGASFWEIAKHIREILHSNRRIDTGETCGTCQDARKRTRDAHWCRLVFFQVHQARTVLLVLHRRAGT